MVEGNRTSVDQLEQSKRPEPLLDWVQLAVPVTVTLPLPARLALTRPLAL